MDYMDIINIFHYSVWWHISSLFMSIIYSGLKRELFSTQLTIYTALFFKVAVLLFFTYSFMQQCNDYRSIWHYFTGILIQYFSNMEPIKSSKHSIQSGFLNSLFVFGLLLFTIWCGFLSCKKNNNSDDNNNLSGNSAVQLQLVADNMVSPVLALEAPDASKRLFIVDQNGKIWIVDQNGQKLTTPFINMTSKLVSLNNGYDERGLLGMAFHPDYKTNGKFYLFYNAPPHSGGPEPGKTWSSITRVSEFHVSSDPNLADIGSEKIILEADHPQMNHNGGTIAFGPDGYLYISIGDGGNKDDVGPGHMSDWYAVNAGGNAQNIRANLLGKILRIDVNAGNPYSIPSDNPFVGTPAKPEIYAYGLRNPYRFSFDMGGSHQLFAGDAGQSLYEEIDIITKGGNYGWNIKEGTICFSTDNDLHVLDTCPTMDSMGNKLIDPVIQLKNAANPTGGQATTIIGGYVYRGTTILGMASRYVFGIFSQKDQPAGKIYVANAGATSYEEISLKNNFNEYIKGFGQDLSGEIYVTTSSEAGLAGTSGKVYKLVKAQ
jgi:glucose/arabinose dehydrogenase